MLQLLSLNIENFGPFKGLQSIAFSPEDGVTIFYGENMRGKTSLLNAIRFAFFGKVIGRGTKSGELHKIGNWEQAAEGKYGFKVELEFKSDSQNYKLTRLCTSRIPEPKIDDDYNVEYFLERDNVVLGPDQTNAELLRILPEQISRFFLFDGELLQEYEDLLSNESDMGARISNAIEQILGVPILTASRATAMRLKDSSESREAKAAQNNLKTQEYGNQLADLQTSRRLFRKELEKSKLDLETLRHNKASLEESLKRRERYATLMSRRDSLSEDIKNLETRLVEKKGGLKENMASAWCSLLANPLKEADVALRERQSDLEQKVMRHNVLADLRSNASKNCPTCLQEITPAIRQQIENSVGTEENDTSINISLVLQEVRIQRTALESVLNTERSETLKLQWEAVEEIAIDIASKKNSYEEIIKQLENVDEKSLRREKADYEQTIKKIDVAERSVEATEKLIIENQSNTEGIQKRLDATDSRDLERERFRRGLYTQLHNLLGEAIAAYREKLRQRVESDASRHFRALTTEPDYAGLKINQNYGLTIVHKDGNEIPIRSAGAEHVVALSLVGALQNNAPLQGPIIIDSPFGRLDSGHTSNIVKALPNMARQVMLLVYEDELPPEVARRQLLGKLRAEWRLERISARHTNLTLLSN